MRTVGKLVHCSLEGVKGSQSVRARAKLPFSQCALQLLV